ncbi:glycosyltransferase family 4 protein [Plantactinospora soyae]|uniref:Glycosyltransferase involved in cell wall biosynthesis n=1 Tax=Plantactinospora soyae TaxID=1544732 RepID=A0A927R770_9ACTN|nr:glycosyltransferase family 4 protein [Plantactinospora soyae]MBE1487576.1 glycosyltransferase involved in cell wall biosynthesis [Plantactinospora soyae]
MTEQTAGPGAQANPVYVVLPGDVDDQASPSGGNGYDRRVCRGLTAAGWQVSELPVQGAWPRPVRADRAGLADALADVPDDAVVLLDGLVACGVPDVVAAEADRLRLAVLVHLPLADETGLAPAEAAERDAWERETLRAVRAVIATSAWTGRRLIEHHGLPAGRVFVAAPGVEAAPLASGTADGARLLCVAALTPRKGQDVLIEALATIRELPWTCHLVGPLGRAVEYVDRLRGLTARHDLADRVVFTGPRGGPELAASYAAADLLILPSHSETYGMVVTEALACGIPVLSTDVDGIPEAVGRAPDGSVPGLLVPAADPVALAGALRRWLTEPDLRSRLRRAARDRRATLLGWETTVQTMSGVLERLRREPGRAG